MIDQFETEKCLYAASADSLVLMIIASRPDPGNLDVTNPGHGLRVGANPWGSPGRCWFLDLTDG